MSFCCEALAPRRWQIPSGRAYDVYKEALGKQSLTRAAHVPYSPAIQVISKILRAFPNFVPPGSTVVSQGDVVLRAKSYTDDLVASSVRCGKAAGSPVLDPPGYVRSRSRTWSVHIGSWPDTRPRMACKLCTRSSRAAVEAKWNEEKEG